MHVCTVWCIGRRRSMALGKLSVVEVAVEVEVALQIFLRGVS